MAPFADRGGVDRAANLNGACGCRRRLALIETQDTVLPGQAEECDQAAALLGLIAHNVLVTDIHERTRRQRRLPMPREAAIGQDVVRKFGLIVGRQELAWK
jgi:hypothetical protein